MDEQKKRVIIAILASILSIIIAQMGNQIIELKQEVHDLSIVNARLSHEIADLSEEIAKNDKYIVVQSFDAKTTAYCPCKRCCGKSDGITATGTKATEGKTIAVDPSIIPYGTKVLIDGNIYTAEDCGGAIKGNRIDVYFDTHEKAIEYGVREKEIKILREVEDEV